MSIAESPVRPQGPPLKVVYKSQTKATWCPGCGDYGVMAALEMAFRALKIPPHELVLVSGIGCSSNLPHFFKTYGFHGLHGRAVPVATGIKLANPSLTVVVAGGDGDGYGIGLGHSLHAMRRNLDMTYVVMDNEIYGLTTGQASPTSTLGAKTKSTPLVGVIEAPVNPLALALGAGATFVARAFSGDPKQMADLLAQGIRHKGFALVDVFSPCVTYNHLNTFDFFRSRVYKLESVGHDPSDPVEAFRRTLEWGERIPTGLFYRAERPTYEELEPALKDGPLTTQRAGLPPDVDPLKEFY